MMSRFGKNQIGISEDHTCRIVYPKFEKYMYSMSKIVLHVPVFLTPSAIIPNTVHSRKGHALLHPPLPKSLLALVEEADKMVY